MGDYCLRFNAAAQEVHALTAENELLHKRIAELEANDCDTCHGMRELYLWGGSARTGRLITTPCPECSSKGGGK